MLNQKASVNESLLWKRIANKNIFLFIFLLFFMIYVGLNKPFLLPIYAQM